MTDQLGQANFSAYRVWEYFVAVVATGSSPTSGWMHEFRQGIVPNNELWFFSQPPSGFVTQVVTPFQVVRILSLQVSEDVVRVFHKGGNPEEIPIKSISEADQLVQSVVEAYSPPVADLPAGSPIQGDGLPVRLETGNLGLGTSGAYTAARSAIYYERRLGSWESPEICKCKVKGFEITCSNKHYTATLRIRVGSPQDIGKAVEDCLRDAAIGAAVVALVAVIATGGAAFASAKAAFLNLFTACLAAKLSNIISVDVDLEDECR